MKSKVKKVNHNQIQGREISENEIQENLAETFKKKAILFYLPLAITLILAIIYILTQKWFLLIIIALVFFWGLFGIEGNGNTCPECHKWGKVMWDSKGERKIRTVKHTITKSDGTEVTKEEKEEVDRKKGKCLNCGKEVQKEKVKRIKK